MASKILEAALAQQTFHYLQQKTAEALQRSQGFQSGTQSSREKRIGESIRRKLNNILHSNSDSSLYMMVAILIEERYPDSASESERGTRRPTRSETENKASSSSSLEADGQDHDQSVPAKTTHPRSTSPSTWNDNQHMDRYMDLWIGGFPDAAFNHIISISKEDPLRGDSLFEIMVTTCQTQTDELLAARQRYRTTYPDIFPNPPQPKTLRDTPASQPTAATIPLKRKIAPTRTDIPKIPIPGYRFKCCFKHCGTERKDKTLFTEHMSKTHFRDEEMTVEGKFFISTVNKDKLTWGAKLREDAPEERCTGVFTKVPEKKKKAGGRKRTKSASARESEVEDHDMGPSGSEYEDD